MGRKRHSAEEVVNIQRQADVEVVTGRTEAAVCKLLEITDQTYLRWRDEYNSVRPHSSLRYRPPAPEAIAARAPFAPLLAAQQQASEPLVSS